MAFVVGKTVVMCFVESDEVGMEVKRKLHGNTKGKRYALNHKVVATMQ